MIVVVAVAVVVVVGTAVVVCDAYQKEDNRIISSVMVLQKLRAYARNIGMETHEYKDLLWLAKEGAEQALPGKSPKRYRRKQKVQLLSSQLGSVM